MFTFTVMFSSAYRTMVEEQEHPFQKVRGDTKSGIIQRNNIFWWNGCCSFGPKWHSKITDLYLHLKLWLSHFECALDSFSVGSFCHWVLADNWQTPRILKLEEALPFTAWVTRSRPHNCSLRLRLLKIEPTFRNLESKTKHAFCRTLPFPWSLSPTQLPSLIGHLMLITLEVKTGQTRTISYLFIHKKQRWSRQGVKRQAERSFYSLWNWEWSLRNGWKY